MTESVHHRPSGREAYYTALKREPTRRGPVKGLWAPDPTVDPHTLRDRIEKAEGHSETRLLKYHDRIRVLRSRLFDREVIIKRFNLTGPYDYFKHLFRTSRGRRSWAAGHALSVLGLPTPDPLGYLEIIRAGVPVRSYALTAFLEGAQSAREWIKPHYHRQSAEIQRSFRANLLAHLLALYRNNVYHADTKATNLLLRAPTDPDQRAFYWVDLECVRFGVRPSRRRIIRNLVQLNGSIGGHVPEADRRAFLHDLAREYPWLLEPRVERTIRDKTRRRLMRRVTP